MKFTPSQQAAISVTDRDLIVSAGAGAGKTATLIERVYRLLSAETDPCTVDQLLIVTFTRAAAREMKERLAARLSAELAAASLEGARRDHLEQQLFLLPRANISTIHSYCLELITANPEAAGLPPGFDLMPEGEARLFHQDFVAEKIEEALGGDGPATDAVHLLLRQLDPVGGTDALRATVISLHGFLASLPEPQRFLETCELLLHPDKPEAREKLLHGHLRDRLAALRSKMDAAIAPYRPDDLYRLRASRDHFAALSDAIAAALDAPDFPASLANLPESWKAPRVTGRRENNTTADGEYHALVHGELNKHVGGEQGALAPLLGPGAAGLLLESRECILALVRHLGIQWLDDLDARHVELRRLTFHHLEKLALRILDGPDGNGSEVARIEQQRFRHVLIDEFQDVNEFQERILRRVRRPADAGSGGNFFVVGDVKQSIYAFRQADPSLFLGIYTQSAPLRAGEPPARGARLDLAENFRSAAPLLGEFNALFRKLLLHGTIGLDYTDGQEFLAGRADDPEKPPRCPARLQLDLLPKAPLPAGNGGEEGGDGPRQSSDASPEEESAREELLPEAEHTAALVEAAGPPWRDIAILLRNARNTAPALVEALERRGIPVYTDSRAGYLTAVEIIELQYLLRAIHNPYEDLALLALLRGPAARWTEDDLLRLRHAAHGAPFFDNLCLAAGRDDHPLHAPASATLADIQRWQDLASRRSIAEFLSALYDDLHLLERASARPGGDQRKRNLLQMIQHAHEFDGFQRQGLGGFLRYLEDLLANDEDFAPPVPLAGDADVVRIMTVHKSKGMQFPIVVAPFLGAQINDRDAAANVIWNRGTGLATKFRDDARVAADKPHLFNLFVHERRKQTRSEEMRLLYVLLTRAREAVYMVASARHPEKAVARARTLLRQGFPPHELLAARDPLTWLLPHAMERLGLDDPQPDGRVHTDGAFAFRFLSAPMESAEGGLPREEETTDAWRQPYAEALERIRGLQDAPERPLVRAKLSVSEAKRAFDAVRDAETPSYPRPEARARHAGRGASRLPDWRPAGLAPDTPTGGAATGTATHRFLATCDLPGISTGRVQLRAELDRLREDALLGDADADRVLLQEIANFLNGELGGRLRRAVQDAWRELPLTVRLDARAFLGPAAPEDFIILQGVADLLFREPEGWVLVDYKTDWCGPTGERVPELLRGYTSQLQLYRLAAEKALGEPVKETWLVFLRAGQEHPVAPRGEEPFRWEEIVEAGALVTPAEAPPRRVRTTREV